MSKTATSAFGASRRESHDASDFYSRSLHDDIPIPLVASSQPQAVPTPQPAVASAPDSWADQLYHLSATAMTPLPDQGVALAFTSPPYNVGKEYDANMSLESYLELIRAVADEVYRVLRPGGRYVVNIANLGRKPYIPLHAYFYGVHMAAGFLPMGEIIWRKGKGANGSCAWGSWRSARAPRLRDVHEYLLVFAKEGFSRPERGESDIERDEFMEATLSVWDILPESAKRVGHPAPFPVELAARVIQLYSYVGDVVLDPFLGSGTTAVGAIQSGRRYVGFEIDPGYFQLAQSRIAEAQNSPRAPQPE
ncbi:MAG: site-specific DNA-methyltransferase [Caldilineaceae bacterium]|nr:site-specific DNA-methyltransferase [Caldilineaceae bacterium]